MLKTQSFRWRAAQMTVVATLGLASAMSVATAQNVSGGSSGGGAIQGGTGAPGGGVGVPGAALDGTTATGVGEHVTLSRRPGQQDDRGYDQGQAGQRHDPR